MLRLCVGEYCLRDTAVAGRPPSPSSLPIPLIEYPFEGARLRNVEYDMLLLAEPLLYADDGAIVEGHLGCESVEQLLLYYNVRRKSSLPIQTCHRHSENAVDHAEFLPGAPFFLEGKLS